MASKLGLAFKEWRRRSLLRKLFDIVLAAFAAAGFAILGAWLLFQLGVTNNGGARDKNYRYLASVTEMTKNAKGAAGDTAATCDMWQYARLATFARFYPDNARNILKAVELSNGKANIDQMIAAAIIYDDSTGVCEALSALDELKGRYPQRRHANAIPWMATDEWELLKPSIAKDSAAIREAARLTGVEPRLIAACLVGEQIRLFNTKREKVKQYLGPMKVLAVENQLSWGVNGIKEYTAIAVERNLKDSLSEFYMGRKYEHLLDFETDDTASERYNRIVNYRDHLYSYIYTGCILHQTKLQWERAGYDISGRPDILVTLFNLGFQVSKPKANPVCGGSRVVVDDVTYTFGALGFDFYYSGEMSDVFPYTGQIFASEATSATQVGDMIRLGDTIVTNIPKAMPKIRKNDSTTRDSSTSAPTTLTTPAAQTKKQDSII
ncbi:MAG: hypothetical protein IJU81_07410 [Bacteroidales bacterium]|nr:hypothetical protein [Bacteroidales bacterium]